MKLKKWFNNTSLDISFINCWTVLLNKRKKILASLVWFVFVSMFVFVTLYFHCYWSSSFCSKPAKRHSRLGELFDFDLKIGNLTVRWEKHWRFSSGKRRHVMNTVLTKMMVSMWRRHSGNQCYFNYGRSHSIDLSI